MSETSPNDKIYNLKWNDTGVVYSHPHSHKMDFHLDEAMLIAGFEEVTVVDSETGAVLWVGGPAVRATPAAAGPSDALRREMDERATWTPPGE